MGRYRRHLIALAIVAVLLGGYAAAGFLAVPHYARKGLQDFGHQHYGRTLAIGEIRFNPFTLALDMSGFSLPDADAQPLLAFKRLHLGLRLASVWRLAPSFREILLEQPYVRAVIRPDGALSLADLGKGFPPAPPQPTQKSEPVRLLIRRLAVISGTAAFDDRTRPFHAEFKPIAFELRDFSTTARTGNDYTLNAASPEGERLTWSGTVHLAPVSSHGQFEIADLQARTLWRYMRESLAFEIPSGVIAIKGDYDLSSDGAADNCIELARIHLTDARLDLAHHAVDIAKVTLNGGDIKAWVGEHGRLNLLDLAAPPAPAAAAATTAAAATATATAAAATTLGAKLDIEGDADGVLTVKGKTGVGGLSTVDDALKQDFIKWRALLISDVSYRSKPASLRIGSVTALEPYARMIIAPDRTLNITEILKRPGASPQTAAVAGAPQPADSAAAAAVPAAAPTPFPMSISTVRLVNASVNYSDLWIKPSLAVGIRTLDGTVSGLSSDPKSRARMELNGKVERYPPVHIGGEINPAVGGALYGRHDELQGSRSHHRESLLQSLRRLQYRQGEARGRCLLQDRPAQARRAAAFRGGSTRARRPATRSGWRWR